ncbi:hypothetical protein ACET3X_007205 [Alternaria dauci]|uniref:Uncharacterized protein n=1 Tax=Alternaria dauci TaxID=48095 RepID=A0ABR3UHT4_9PLEO
MNVFQNVVGLFSSPAKVATAGKKRDGGEASAGRSAEKRKRTMEEYDPSEYQTAGYGGVGSESEDEDEEEEEEHQAQDQLLQEQLRIEAEHTDVRSTAPHKPIRRPTRAVLHALASNKTLDKTEKLLATKPDSDTKREKLAAIQHARAKNDAIVKKAEMEVYTQEGRQGARVLVEKTPIPRTASADTFMVAVGSETETDSDSASETNSESEEAEPDTPHQPTHSDTSIPMDMPWTTPPPSPPLHSHRSPVLQTFTTTALFSPPNWRRTIPSQKWTTHPNLRARDLSSDAARIRQDLPLEPGYAFRDTEIRDSIWYLMSCIERFSKAFIPEGGVDGFDRKIAYTAIIRAHLPTPTSLPSNFNAHVNTIITALYTHLSPLLTLVAPHAPPSLQTLFSHLHHIVATAGLLSLHMALTPHTLYHHVPLFKEDVYVSASMECFNDVSMRLRNPRTSLSAPSSDPVFKPSQEALDQETVRRSAMDESEKRRARGDVPVTQIVCMPGITTYRRGGWEKPSSPTSGAAASDTTETPVYQKRGYEDMGIRVRVLTQGWVYCRWGRARSSGRMPDRGSEGYEEAGRKIHGDAWREGGFVGFTEVDGVVDWRGLEREEKQKEKEMAVGVVEGSDGNTKDVGKATELTKEKRKKKDKAKAKSVSEADAYLESLEDPDL